MRNSVKKIGKIMSRINLTRDVITLIILVAIGTTLLTCKNDVKSKEFVMIKEVNLSSYSAEPPKHKINLLFIHHSSGGQWLAESGNKDECKDWICKNSPNGGGLRMLLEQNNYVVHEASYNSIIGDKTDIQDWPPKFLEHMDRVLKTKMQDELLSGDEKNQVVMFKSCFPNNNFQTDQEVQQAKSAYNELLAVFQKHPDVLFVAVTAPPLISPNNPKELFKRLLGKWVPDKNAGKRARVFNNWLKDIDKGWLNNYPLKNVIVFDYYDILTKNGKSDWSEYGSKAGTDSHPNSKGNQIAAQHFIGFINRAVRYAGIILD